MENIDLYAERVVPGFWGEPINTVSNVAFIIAAWAIAALISRSNLSSRPLRALVALTWCVGIGSAIFHLFATQWSWFFDIIPIVTYELVFFWFYLRRLAHWKRVSASIALGALACATFGFWLVPVAQRSLLYVPALVLLFVLSIFHAQRFRTERFSLFVSAILFLAAYAFRSIDLIVEPYVPWGTHFLWHIFDAAVIYFSLRGLVANWADNSHFEKR